MPEVQEVFRMATQKVRPDPGFVDRQHDRRRRRDRNRKIGALAVVAAIGAVAVGLSLVSTRTNLGDAPPDTPFTEWPVDPKAVEVATGFVEAYRAFDAERTVTYLADFVDLRLDVTTPEELPLLLSFLEAEGYREIPLAPCRATGANAFGTQVLCAFGWHAIRSDEIGLGPYPGRWELTVRDGMIVEVRQHWAIKRFAPEVWEPFRDWVSANHPDDFDAMYVRGGTNFRITEESIRLWGRYTSEYVKDVGAAH